MAEEASVTLLSDAEMDNVVAGASVQLAKTLRVGGHVDPKTGDLTFKFIDFSDRPEQAAAKLFNGDLPDNNGKGTNVIDQTLANPAPGATVDVYGTNVGSPNEVSTGAAFYIITLNTP